jgi:hypothetical protein
MHLASKYEGYFKLAVRGSVTSVTNVEGVNGTVSDVTVTHTPTPQNTQKSLLRLGKEEQDFLDDDFG